jgi:hypothetical protein
MEEVTITLAITALMGLLSLVKAACMSGTNLF